MNKSQTTASAVNLDFKNLITQQKLNAHIYCKLLQIISVDHLIAMARRLPFHHEIYLVINQAFRYGFNSKINSVVKIQEDGFDNFNATFIFILNKRLSAF